MHLFYCYSNLIESANHRVTHTPKVSPAFIEYSIMIHSMSALTIAIDAEIVIEVVVCITLKLYCFANNHSICK